MCVYFRLRWKARTRSFSVRLNSLLPFATLTWHRGSRFLDFHSFILLEDLSVSEVLAATQYIVHSLCILPKGV